jgi:hypothetical protein
MTSTVATEIPQPPAAPTPHLETLGANERMRHIPAAEWIAEKVDGDIRRRIDILCTSFGSLAQADPVRQAADAELTALCRSLDKLADLAKHSRSNAHGADIATKVREALAHAAANLRAMDANAFGRRAPFHAFERSKAEPLVAALLVVISCVNRVTTVLRQADPRLDEHLLEGLVVLREPLRSEPIA